MRILAVGGGSGGHVTPVVAVLRELRAQRPRVEMRFWCDTKFAPQARSIVEAFDPSLPVHTIVAGKLIADGAIDCGVRVRPDAGTDPPAGSAARACGFR